MGKDAANTLFTENQEQVAPEQFKGQAGISSEMNKGTGLELRQPEGDKFHGDMLKPDMSAQYNSTSRPAQLMQDPTTGTAGGFHGDALLGSQTFTGEPRMGEQFKDSHLTNRMGDEFPAGQLNQGSFNEAVILKPHSSSISSSLPLAQSGKMETFSATSLDDRGAMSSADHHHSDMGATHIHDGRHAGMLPDGRTVNQSALLHDTMRDDTMRDATIHDGRSRPLVSEAADSSVPLSERVVAGVHAGDPLSRKGKLTSVFKKDQHKGSEFDKEGIIKGDNDLIPHEHLKKSEPHLAEDHLSSGPMLTRQQNNFEAHEPLMDMHQKDAHMKDAHILQPALQSALGPREHAVETFSATGLTSSDSHAFNKDSHLSKDLDRSHLTSDKSHLSRDSGTSADINTQGKGAKLKEKLHIKKEKLKEKLHMKKDGSKKDELGESGHAHTEARANPKGHEIATIKIPGIESGDRAAQEMVNHQAKAKKELNAELKEHVGHSDHIAPSEILGVGHGMSQMSLHENRAVDSGADDALLKDNILAKQAVNAEIKDHAGAGFGLHHHEMPADQFQREGQFQREMSADQFQRESLQAKQAVNAEIMDHAGTGFGLQHREILPTGQFQQGDLQAKQAVNAEIKEHAGTGFGLHHLEIVPTDLSKDQFQREDLSQRHDQFHSKDFFQKDSDILSKDLHDSQKKDFVPSTDKDDIEISDFQRRALHKNKAHDHAEVQPSMTQTVKDKVATAATAVKDTVNNMALQDKIATATTAVKGTVNNMALQDKVTTAATTVKDTVNNMALQDKIATATTAVKGTVNNMALQDKVTTAATTVKDTVNNMALQDKVATAATAVKGTVNNMGNTISNMMPSSNSSAPINEHAPMGVMDLKDDVNAEIRALGATHPNHIMPSDVSTMHTSAAPAAAGLASYIPEKVTHAATALKDTLGNKISSMMPSSHASASAPAPRDVMEDLEKKDIVLAKNEVNTEIKALGATSSDNIMPSDVSTMHTSAAPAAGLASYIPEKVTHAAVALKDTLGNKISSMMPSSHAPASAPVDFEEKDAILAKDEVNAEIRALGATSSENIMPSDISSMHTSAAPAAGLASYTEKVTHAAVALKDTLGSKISGFLPSSSTVPASHEVVIADLAEKTEAVEAKNEINAEIRELGSGLGSGNIMPSEISSSSTAPNAGTTIIHDGRSEIPDITDGGRLKSEMDYNQAHDDSAPRGSEDSHLSMRQMIQEKVTNAAMAVKETLHF